MPLSTRAVSTIAVTADHRARPTWAVASLASRKARGAVAVVGLVAGVGGGLLLATSDHLARPGAYGAQVAVIVTGTVAAALYWLTRRPGNPIGALLLAYAAAAAGLALQGASSPLLHSLGVLFDAPIFLLGWWLVLAFPLGRLAGTLERVLVGAVAVALLTSFVPWFFFSPVVSGGAPLAGCTADCPQNALMIADRPSIADGLGTTEQYYSVFVGGAIALGLLYRLLGAAKPRRRALLPVSLPALLLIGPYVLFHAAGVGLVSLDASTYDTVGWFVTAGRTTLSLGFLLAIAQATVYAGLSLRAIMSRVGHGRDATHLRALVAEALDDPRLELAFETGAGEGLVDSRGEPVDIARPGRGRAATAFLQRGSPA